MAGESIITKLQNARAMSNAALVSVIVAHGYSLRPEDVLHARRTSGDALLAQKIAMYICTVELRCSGRSVARAFSCSDDKVRRAVKWVEDERDKSEFDARVDVLVKKTCPIDGGAPVKYA